MKMTKAYAKDILNLWKDKATLFGDMNIAVFESYLQELHGIGRAESIVISMALVMAGIKFAE